MRADVIVAGVGHAWLNDQSFGLKVVDRLRAVGLPPAVDAADWSFGAIAALQRLWDRPYRRAIFVSATARGRPPGVLYRQRPAIELPPESEIQARVGDSVMGVVSVDNLIVIARYLQKLPDDVVLIEAEPVDETWGDRLSPLVRPLRDAAVAAVLEEIDRPGDA